MANIVGIDMGHDRLKIVYQTGKKIRKAVVADMPENIMKGGLVVSVETMGEFIRETMKKNGISASQGAVVFSGERVYVRNITMPIMTNEQLMYNLPYEFKDYITEELKDYAFDYAVRGANEEEKTMNILGAAIPRTILDDSRAIFRKAGLKLVKAAPAISVYQALIRDYEKAHPTRDYVFLNLGFRSIRLDVFHGTEYQTTHVFDTGLRNLDSVIAESMGVDTHLAHTYITSNYKGCLESEECKGVFVNIAVELVRTMNFLQYSMQDNNLNEIWVSGGGANIMPLRNEIETHLELPVKSAYEELLKSSANRIEEGDSALMAYGILRDM